MIDPGRLDELWGDRPIGLGGRPNVEPYPQVCEAAIAKVCHGRAVHRHHLRLRSQGGHDGPTVMLCAACHHWTHTNPAEARKRGLLL